MNPETKDLLRALLAAARGDHPAGHEETARKLATPGVIEQLDSEEDYANAAKFRLRVSQVVEALAANPHGSARAAFVALTSDEIFNAHDERTLALVRASVHVRPAPAPLVAFWDRHCQPDDGFTPTTITVLLDNGSQPALELFAAKMADESHEDDDKLSWMRTRVLPHRNDPALLEVCERLLLGAMPERLAAPLVEVLFDYRPAEWFRPTSNVAVPTLESAPRETVELVLKVGTVALTMVRLTDQQRSAVKARMEQAEQLRARRWPGTAPGSPPGPPPGSRP